VRGLGRITYQGMGRPGQPGEASQPGEIHLGRVSSDLFRVEG
jgi:hypothetical protein